MSRSEFVGADVERLDLSGEGRWVEVKREIGIRESKRIESALFGGIRGVQELIGRQDLTGADIEMRLDGSQAFLLKLETYLVDWSFRDASDKPVKVNKSSIAALRPETAEEILAKLNEFLEVQERERQTDPFVPGGASQSA